MYRVAHDIKWYHPCFKGIDDWAMLKLSGAPWGNPPSILGTPRAGWFLLGKIPSING